MKKLLAISIASMFILTSCTSKDSEVNKPSETENVTSTNNENESNSDTSSESNVLEAEFTVTNENEMLLYNRFNSYIVSYNTTNHNVVNDNVIKKGNLMHHGFDNLESSLYLISEYGNTDKIVEMSDKELTTLCVVKYPMGLLPVAYEDDDNIYIEKYSTESTSNSDEEAQKKAKSVLCKFNRKTNELEEIEATRGLSINIATVVDDYLYFIQSEGRRYDLYKMNLKTYDEPELVLENLISVDIYNNNGNLWLSDNDFLFDFEDPTNKLPKKLKNYFYNDYLFQLDWLNPEDEENDDAMLTITDTRTKEELKTFPEVIDFKVDGNTVTIYTKSEIATLELDK